MRGDMIFVRNRPRIRARLRRRRHRAPATVVIVGGGAAGLAAADMLRRDGLRAADHADQRRGRAAVDRPNLSKDYLAGDAPKTTGCRCGARGLLREQRHRPGARHAVSALDVARASGARSTNGERRQFGALLIATGADPVRLPIPGADSPHVHYLRSFADSRAIIDEGAVGASTWSWSARASSGSRWRPRSARGVSRCTSSRRSRVPLERVMGPELGRFVAGYTRSRASCSTSAQTVAGVDGRTVTLSGGTTLDADFVVVGVGVRPATALAEQAGLARRSGHRRERVPRDERARDLCRRRHRALARPASGERIRVEHWVVAERQGQAAARNMLGASRALRRRAVLLEPALRRDDQYVGHAERWETVAIDGSLERA